MKRKIDFLKVVIDVVDYVSMTITVQINEEIYFTRVEYQTDDDLLSRLDQVFGQAKREIKEAFSAEASE